MQNVWFPPNFVRRLWLNCCAATLTESIIFVRLRISLAVLLLFSTQSFAFDAVTTEKVNSAVAFNMPCAKFFGKSPILPAGTKVKPVSIRKEGKKTIATIPDGFKSIVFFGRMLSGGKSLQYCITKKN